MVAAKSSVFIVVILSLSMQPCGPWCLHPLVVRGMACQLFLGANLLSFLAVLLAPWSATAVPSVGPTLLAKAV
jgi:hypothetical protein